LASAKVDDNSGFGALFIVDVPPFIPGPSTASAVDSVGNTIDPSLPYYSGFNIPTFTLIDGTEPTPTSGPPQTPEPSPTPEPTATPTPVPTWSNNTQVERAFPNLSFRRQTNLLQPDDGSNLIFISELSGRILVFEDDQNAERSDVYLDITDRVFSGATPEGLLGIAFDPDYESDGYFYVYYFTAGVPDEPASPDWEYSKNPRRSVVSRLSATADDPRKADVDSELVIIEIHQPTVSHNAGQLAFGPDGYLYISLGDGGFIPRDDNPAVNGRTRPRCWGRYFV
jgi:glucose/arabinose dehydrogenase